jgi:hypothetical protein
MTELQAGWFAGQLPPRIAAQIAREDAREAVETRRSAEARELAAEQWRDRNMAMAREQAEARGEVISAMALATGQVPGRTVADIFRSALAASEREDAIAAARASREGTQPVHINFDDPVIHHAPASPVKRAILNRSRRWNEYQERRRAAELARVAMEEENLIPLREAVQLNRERAARPDVIMHDRVIAYERSDPDRDTVRIRGGGEITGVW